VLEMGPKNGPTELADIGDDEGRAEVSPDDKLGSLWIIDHPEGRT